MFRWKEKELKQLHQPKKGETEKKKRSKSENETILSVMKKQENKEEIG